jgi:hypothetical protein
MAKKRAKRVLVLGGRGGGENSNIHKHTLIDERNASRIVWFTTLIFIPNHMWVVHILLRIVWRLNYKQ